MTLGQIAEILETAQIGIPTTRAGMKSTFTMLLVACWANVAISAQNIVVLLDDSGSMEERMNRQQTRRIDAAKDALLTVLNQVPDNSRVGVLALNGNSGNGEWIIELGPVDKSRIQDAVGRIHAGGGTPLGAFIKQATDALLELREKQFYGTYRLLIVTDGEANDGSYLESILPDVLSRNITIDVIGVDMRQRHSLATQVDNYRRADDPESLTTAISESLAEVAFPADDEESAGSDYDLLDGLPDDVASAIINGLVQHENSPIAPPKFEAAASRGRSVIPVESTQENGGSVMGLAILLIAGFAALRVVVGLLKQQGRRRSH